MTSYVTRMRTLNQLFGKGKEIPSCLVKNQPFQVHWFSLPPTIYSVTLPISISINLWMSRLLVFGHSWLGFLTRGTNRKKKEREKTPSILATSFCLKWPVQCMQRLCPLLLFCDTQFKELYRGVGGVGGEVRGQSKCRLQSFWPLFLHLQWPNL